MKTLLKKAYPYYGKIYGVLIICILLGLFQGILMLVEPQIIALLADRVLAPALGFLPEDNSSIFLFLLQDVPKENVWQAMWILSGAFLLFLLVYFITFYIRWNLAHYFSIRQDNKLRQDVLKKINAFGPRIFKEYTTGELLTIANSDTGKLRDAHIGILPFSVDSVFAIVAGSVLLSRISGWLMLLPLAALFVYMLVTKKFLKRMGTGYSDLWEKSTKLNTETQESIYGIRTIKAYAREEHRMERFGRRSEAVRDSYTELGNQRYRFMLLFHTGDQLVVLFCMIVSIVLALKMKMTGGEYMAFASYMLLIVGNFVELIFHLADMQDACVSAKRLFLFLEKKNSVKEAYGTGKVSKTPSISVENLVAGEENYFFLDQVSVQIPYGKKLGIMGKTGSGKSVFLKVLQGFIEPDAGTICIDGKECHFYSLKQLAETFSYAMQDVFLFSDSIKANISYYNPEIPQKQIYECAKAACVEEFVKKLPEGYETIVGERGFGLSGGQKQRIAVARALLKNAPVILLDDCTSALDVHTEAQVFDNLSSFCKNKTLVLATHRASVLRDFDEILFFADGRIVERGTFEELIALNGRYADIYRRQEQKGKENV